MNVVDVETSLQNNGVMGRKKLAGADGFLAEALYLYLGLANDTIALWKAFSCDTLHTNIYGIRTLSRQEMDNEEERKM